MLSVICCLFVCYLISAICYLLSAIWYLASAICFLLSATGYLLSAICYLLSAIYYLLSAICHLLCAICSLLTAIFYLLSSICYVLSAIWHLVSATRCLLSAIFYLSAMCNLISGHLSKTGGFHRRRERCCSWELSWEINWAEGIWANLGDSAVAKREVLVESWAENLVERLTFDRVIPSSPIKYLGLGVGHLNKAGRCCRRQWRAVSRAEGIWAGLNFWRDHPTITAQPRTSPCNFLWDLSLSISWSLSRSKFDCWNAILGPVWAQNGANAGSGWAFYKKKTCHCLECSAVSFF